MRRSARAHAELVEHAEDFLQLAAEVLRLAVVVPVADDVIETLDRFRLRRCRFRE